MPAITGSAVPCHRSAASGEATPGEIPAAGQPQQRHEGKSTREKQGLQT